MVANLVKFGMIYLNSISRWASAPILDRKPGPVKFWFTGKLCPVDRFTIKHQYPMPTVEQELNKLLSSTVYDTFDLICGYWQPQLDKESQSSQSFITPDGIFSPTCVLHGSTNAVLYLQSTLGAELLSDLDQMLLRWLDDILCHAQTVDELIYLIHQCFQMCLKCSL